MKRMSGRSSRKRTAASAAYASYGSYSYESTARAAEPEEQERSGNSVHRAPSVRTESSAKALGLDLPYLFILTVATVASLALCCGYIRTQIDITSTMAKIEKQATELETLKTQNDALETEIKSATDLNRIYRIATQQLGMVYADRGQVIRYKKSESEYVRQYEDIPGEASR